MAISDKVNQRTRIKKILPNGTEIAYSIYPDGRYTLFIGIEDCADNRCVPDGKDLLLSYNEGYTSSIGPLNLEDLKALRKIIRQAIRNYEGNDSIQI